MIDWLVWGLSNPVPYGTVTFVLGIALGALIGRSAKTRPFEIERDKFRSDLSAVLRTIKLKNET